MKSQFFSDLIIVIPFIVSLRMNISILNAILILRTNKMFKMAQYFEQLMNFRPHQSAIFNLFKLVFTIIFVAHFCGCMFFLVGSTEMNMQISEITWIDKAGLNEKDWFEQYVTSLYWAVITMITIGYGDISPVTIYERGFVILITLISCGVFAYSVNQIGSLISALTQNSDSMKLKMGLLIRHLRHRGVNHDLQMQVRKYFEYWHQGKLENDGEQCDQMIESLSTNLRKEVQNDIRYRLINQIPILTTNFSSNFLRNIANHIKTKRTKPEEILIEELQVNDKLYFLIQGIVTSFISIKKDNFTSFTSMKQHKANSIFDQVSFIGDLQCLTGYRSQGSCTLYYICKEDFMNEINNFPIDREKYQLMKDNIIVYKSQRNVGTKCHFCDKYTHSFNHCPFVRYMPYNEKLLMIYRASIEQVRMNHMRADYRFYALPNCQQTKERAVNYLIDNNPFQNEEELIERLQLINVGEDEFDQQQNISRNHKQFNEETDSSSETPNIELEEIQHRQSPHHEQIDPNNYFAYHLEQSSGQKSILTHSNLHTGQNYQGEASTGIFENHILNKKSGSNLNNISQNEISLFPQQIFPFNNGQNTPTNTQQRNQPFQSFNQAVHTFEHSLSNPIADPSIFSNQGGMQSSGHQYLTQSSGKNKKGIKILRQASRRKTKNEDLSGLKIKSRELINLAQASLRGTNRHTTLRKIEEYQNPSDGSSETIGPQEQKKKIPALKVLSSLEIKNEMNGIDENYSNEKKMKKNDLKNYCNPNSLLQIQANNLDVDSTIVSYKNQIQNNHQHLHPSFNYQHSYNQQISDQIDRVHSLVLNQPCQEMFMPVLELDHMKIFTIYYPSGNYPSVIERLEALLIRQFDATGKDKKKFKRSVNKILQIRQLQNMILKKVHSHNKSTTPINAAQNQKKRGSCISNKGLLSLPQNIKDEDDEEDTQTKKK